MGQLFLDKLNNGILPNTINLQHQEQAALESVQQYINNLTIVPIPGSPVTDEEEDIEDADDAPSPLHLETSDSD